MQKETNTFFIITPKLLIVVVLCICMVHSKSAVARENLAIAYIGFSVDRPFWFTLGEAVKKEAVFQGIDLIDLTPPDPDPVLQAKLLDHAVGKKVDGIIIGAISPSSLLPGLTKAAQQKIPIIAVDTEIKHPSIQCFIATDNMQGAKIAGEYIVEKTNKNGTVLILGGTEGHPNGEARRYGVEEKATLAGMNIIFHRANWNDELAYKFVSEELSKENTITAIFSCWDPGIDTASHVIEKMQINKKILLVGFDGLPRTLEYIKKGKVNATIAQNPVMMGKKSVENILAILTGKDFLKEILIPPYLVDIDTLD